MKKTVLGVQIDDIKIDQAVEKVTSFLAKDGKYYIVTPNPEFLVFAQKDQNFRALLNKADLSIPDGVGLKLSGKIQNTVTGVDLLEQLIKVSSEKGFTVGFLGGSSGVAKLCSERLLAKYPSLKITFADGSLQYPNSKDVNLKETNIVLPKTDILFVALGAPKQEIWITQNLDKMPVKVAMGVGGAFDYLSGKVTRAPKWLRQIGLEWLFRLISQPWRIKRQLKLFQYLYYLITSKD